MMGLHEGSWNDNFQIITSAIANIGTDTPMTESMKYNAELLHLCQDFIYAAEIYGRIIISERYLKKKTIRPKDVGGIAGGSKFIVHGILFKFAVDHNHIYGSDYAAAKAAGNELKGLISYFSCGIDDLHVPLMALVDYMGFRLIAISFLPLNSRTLVYGTNDGGHTVHAKDKRMLRIMKRTAKAMNIKPHLCGVDRDKPGVRLYSAADIEGHKGTDGRYYLLDFSRTMPPVKPIPEMPRAHLYRLFRPEFVKKYPIPLCPDAYSGFVNADPDSRQHNLEVDAATKHLTDIVIPRFTKSLIPHVRDAIESGLENFSLSQYFHSSGVNLRYLGLVIAEMRALTSSSTSELSDVQTVLMIEAIARVAKYFLRLLLREKMSKFKQPLKELYSNLAVKYVNLVVGTSEGSKQHWDDDVKAKLKLHFHVPQEFLAQELKPLGSKRANWFIFQRLKQLTGMQFADISEANFLRLCTIVPRPRTYRSTEPDSTSIESPFDNTDLLHLGQRVKHMGIVSDAHGTFYFFKGLLARTAGDIDMSLYLFNLAIDKYQEALDTNPSNKITLRNMANCWLKVAELEKFNCKEMALKTFTLDDPRIKQANRFFQRAVESDKDDPHTLLQYAKFLNRCGALDAAEDHYLRALQADPYFADALREYGQFLSEQGLPDLAEAFFMKWQKVQLEKLSLSMTNCHDGTELCVSDSAASR
mmetsp:Transcript_7050/g.17843  ORF Transcript_7050/g.17843 Transcript_7050/m.17843 type:complete len:699 (+) Transcript_7050:175-2271(+)